MSLSDFSTYSELIYSLPDRYASIQRSTLVLATIGPTLAKLEGQITFDREVVLDVWELAESNETARIEVEPYIMRYIKTLTEAVAAGGEASQAEDYKQYRQHKSRLESLTFEQLFNDDAIAFGDPDKCRARIQSLREELGITYFKLLVNFGGMPHS